MKQEYLLNKVVFIDDDPTTNLIHKKIAESMNLAKSVEFYENCETIWDAYGDGNAEEVPDLVFVDIGLPKVNGVELADKLQQLDQFKTHDTKFCFLTASKDIRDVLKADDLEFDHYYWKPLSKAKMGQVLRETFSISI